MIITAAYAYELPRYGLEIGLLNLLQVYLSAMNYLVGLIGQSYSCMYSELYHLGPQPTVLDFCETVVLSKNLKWMWNMKEMWR